MITEEIRKISDINLAVKSSGSNKKNTLIFIHASSQNSDTWLPQLEDAELNDKYFLLAFDLPGHGQSDWLNNAEDYSPAKIAILIECLIESFEIENYILVGLSYGTIVISEIKPPIHGCKGIVLLSACIVDEVHKPSEFITAGANAHVIAAKNPPYEDLQAFASEHVHNEKLATNFINSYRETDPAFRPELAKALLEGNLTNEIQNIKVWQVPVCIMFGKNETLIKNTYLNDFEPLWKDSVFLINNAGHLVNEENSTDVNRILLSFANDCF